MRRTAMKTIVVAVAALAALTGCATQRPAYYTTPACKTLSVAYGVGLPAGAQAQVGHLDRRAAGQQPSRVTYSTQPAYTTTTYVSQPVYYAPAPVYYAPAPAYYYPPVSIGLDFSFGHWCCRGGWGHRGYYRHR
jgi:predicted small lipoprotein YifL